MRTFLEYTDTVGLYLCTCGEQTLLINGQTYIQKAGMLSIKSPMFVIQVVRQSEDFEACTIFADINTVFPVLRASLDIVKYFRIIEHPCIRLSDGLSDYLQEQASILARRREHLGQVKDPNEHFFLSQSIRLFVQQIFAEFLLQYYRENPVVTGNTDKNALLVFQFLFSLHANFREHRMVQYYADQAHLSSGHFACLVKSVIGQTPSQMIALITIANIKMLLRQTNKSIKEIANDLNFPEQFTFRKYFKQHTGISPKEYRFKS